jgi:hypothetical protein
VSGGRSDDVDDGDGSARRKKWKERMDRISRREEENERRLKLASEHRTTPPDLFPHPSQL